MAGIALKPCFHNGPSGGVIKIKINLFRKKGSLKKMLIPLSYRVSQKKVPTFENS